MRTRCADPLTIGKEAHHRPLDQFVLVLLQTRRDPDVGRGRGDRRLPIHPDGR